MSMNKKIIINFTLFFSMFLFILNVNAKCSDVYSTYAYPTEEQCAQYSEDNFKCRGNGYSGGTLPKLRCEKGFVCVDGYTLEGNSCVRGSSTNSDTSTNSNTNANSSQSSSVSGSSVGGDSYSVKCKSLNKEQCIVNRGCKWNGADCIDSYVAADPCNDDNIKTALRFIGYLLMILRVAVPLVIIVMATIDLYKSVIDKDEKSLSKQVKIIIMRMVAGVFIFFLPTVVYALFNLSSELKIVDSTKYKSCATCLLKPTECSIAD